MSNSFVLISSAFTPLLSTSQNGRERGGGFVSRARISQIMNFLNLAPDIQEEILFLPTILKGREPIAERDVRPAVATVSWESSGKCGKNLSV